MSYLKYGYALLCAMFLLGSPLAGWADDAAPEGEPQLELAEGESADVSTEANYEIDALSTDENDPVTALKEQVNNAAIAGHNGWMLICCALVLFMTAPGLALFYGGLVRKKNVVSVLMQCLFLMGLMSVIWGP